MIIILFRSRLTEDAGNDYRRMDSELDRIVRNQPGFIDVKSFTSSDDERLTVVWWKDQKSLEEWRNLPVHKQAQETGRARWYKYYNMEVAEVVRTSNFEKSKK